MPDPLRAVACAAGRCAHAGVGVGQLSAVAAVALGLVPEEAGVADAPAGVFGAGTPGRVAVAGAVALAPADCIVPGGATPAGAE